MATNEKLLNNAKQSADEYMQKNIQLLQEKQALAIREEKLKIKQRELEKTVDRQKIEISSLQKTDKQVSTKLNLAMQQISDMVNEKTFADAKISNGGIDNLENFERDLNRSKAIIKNQERELERYKMESTGLIRELHEAQNENKKFLTEIGTLELKIESLSFDNSKLRMSFEKSQIALGKALNECQKLLNSQ